MRIAQVSPLYEPVPPRTYGGTERVVAYLTEELVRLGHDVTLFASGDSVTPAVLEPACPRALRLDPSCRDRIAPHVRMLGRVYARADRFDIIHCHTDYLSLPLSRDCGIPTVVTLHGRLDLPEVVSVFEDYPNAPLVSISTAQRAPMNGVRWAGTVHHGLPAGLYSFRRERGDYLLFLGRIAPEKRPDSAIRVAIRARVPLLIAAKVDAVDLAYFESVVRPLLDHPLVRFIGEVDERAKNDLLGRARALLFPIDWPEPFGLAMIEALACGTPVIARRRGSVPEVLSHGRTGLICESEDEMVAAVRRIDQIDRADCRREFEGRFTAAAMARGYLGIYEAVLAERRIESAVRIPVARARQPLDIAGAPATGGTTSWSTPGRAPWSGRDTSTLPRS
ncbi:MAG: glycosyltransferase family 4 protein [Acidobacteriota bacterium]